MQNNTYIEIIRPSEYVNYLRKYYIMINDFNHGTIGIDETVKVELEPGDYEIYLKIDWCQSNHLKFTIHEGDRLIFNCGCMVQGKSIWNPLKLYYYTFIKKEEYLFIRRDENNNKWE
ncbi:hypothetical protein [Bacillus horti]|uniref:Uncharacterized protein n=1 Tax=Caldalkalibacillus horti TaxID=77523 RepID=A0ABT9W2N3_9BACI|nr:hypothetical protein [Bacillus horti]MDQ0167329.1 hypothetical protein [Bacillus horti]